MVDLHVHSTFSDGTDSPEEIVALAKAKGLSAVVLTDHDNAAGQARFAAAAAEVGLRTLTGMELSADVPGRTVHLLAYGFDPAHAELAEAASKIRDGRNARNSEILAKLTKIGCFITMSEVRAAAGSDLIARPHIAQVLVQKGYARDKRDAFDRYLGRKGAAYCERFRLPPEECIRLVRAAGGQVSLAHPASTGYNRSELHQFVEGLVHAGLAGIEVYYTGHLIGQIREYMDLVSEFNLVPTGGSDFHGANKPGIELGTAYGSLAVPDVCFEALADRCATGGAA